MGGSENLYEIYLYSLIYFLLEFQYTKKKHFSRFNDQIRYGFFHLIHNYVTIHNIAKFIYINRGLRKI